MKDFVKSCWGCGHPLHPANECTARPTFGRDRDRCRCTVSSAYADPPASRNWHTLAETSRTCRVVNCGDAEREHKEWKDGAFCRACFDRNPSDDSHIEGGVYHRFRA